MTDFSKFYRMIGIAEHIVQPSYYHLLGLDMNNCTPETVRAALTAKKKELRNHIPGEEFVPMVLKFEREQLEPAAEVLSDDVKRTQYNKELAIKWERIKHENEKRAGMIGTVRKLVAKSIDNNGTLGAEGRRKLADELAAIGVEDHNIEIILDRIPRPLSETGQQTAINKEFFDTSVQLAVDDGVIDKTEKRRLIDLAAMLNLNVENDDSAEMLFGYAEDYSDEDGSVPGEGTASIGAVLCDDDESSNDQLGDEGQLNLAEENLDVKGDDIQLVRQVLDSDKEMHLEGIDLADKEALELIEATGEDVAKEVKGAKNIVPYLIIPVIIAILALLIFLFISVIRSIDFGGRGALIEEEIASIENISGNKKVVPVDVPENTGNEPVDTQAKDNHPEMIVDPNSDLVVYMGEISPVLKDLTGRDYLKMNANGLLADCVLGMLACTERVSEIKGGSFHFNQDLDLALDMPLKSRMAVFESLSEHVGIDKSYYFVEKNGPVFTTGEDMLNSWYQGLKNDIESSDKVVRYRAIDRLEADGSERAIEILLGPRENPFIGTKQTVSRRLRALSRISSNYIVSEIALRIGTTPRSATARQLSLALIDITGITPKNNGILSPKNDYQNRVMCSQWWLNEIKDWSPASEKGVMGIVSNQTRSDTVKPDKLVSALMFYVHQAAKMLAEDMALKYEPEDLGSAEWYNVPDSNSVETGLAPKELLVKTTSEFYYELERMFRENPYSDKYLVKMDIIALERDAAKLASDTALQKAAVDIFAAGRVIELLVRVNQRSEINDPFLKSIWQKRLEDNQKAGNVLQQIRQNIYHNLRLLELLASQ